MNRPPYRSWAIPAGLFLVAVLSLAPVVDQRAEGNYSSLFQRALVTFALARTLNGVISVVQGTELALQPAGVGLTLTPGEILDPVNDLVERFSWIMLGATVSLGIQQVLLEVSAWWLLKGVAAVLALSLALVYLFSPAPGDRPRRVLARVFLVAVFLRFAVPLTLIANDLIYQQFLHQRYTSAATVISDASDEISRIGNTEPPEETAQGQGGLFGSLGKAMDNTRQALDLGERVERIKVRAGQMIEHLIELSVVFVLQTAILPLGFLWLFLQGIKWALRMGVRN